MRTGVRTQEYGYHLRMLKPGVQSSLVRGLEQWLWFLGMDVRHQMGNLLLKNGFVKFKPNGTGGSSRYQREWRGGYIDLHSYSVGFCSKEHKGFQYVRARHQCFIYTSSNPPFPGCYPEEFLIAADSDEKMCHLHSAATHFLEWVEEYERWVDSACGSKYREDCYQAYKRKWQPPVTGRAWFRRFCRQPTSIEPIAPVVTDMDLPRSHEALNLTASAPPSLAVKPDTALLPLPSSS